MSDIYDAIEMGVKNLPTIDTIHDIDPLVEEINIIDIAYNGGSLNDI